MLGASSVNDKEVKLASSNDTRYRHVVSELSPNYQQQ